MDIVTPLPKSPSAISGWPLCGRPRLGEARECRRHERVSGPSSPRTKTTANHTRPQPNYNPNLIHFYPSLLSTRGMTEARYTRQQIRCSRPIVGVTRKTGHDQSPQTRPAPRCWLRAQRTLPRVRRLTERTFTDRFEARESDTANHGLVRHHTERPHVLRS